MASGMPSSRRQIHPSKARRMNPHSRQVPYRHCRARHHSGWGLASACLYLVEGKPGAGKTTLAMQFLMEGRRQGERCLYVTLSETQWELDAVASSHD